MEIHVLELWSTSAAEKGRGRPLIAQIASWIILVYWLETISGRKFATEVKLATRTDICPQTCSNRLKEYAWQGGVPSRSPWFQKETMQNASILYRITQTSLQSCATDWFSNKFKIFWCDDRGIVGKSIWECRGFGMYCTQWLGRLHLIDGIMNPEVCMEILNYQMLLPPVTCRVDITFFRMTTTHSTNFL